MMHTRQTSSRLHQNSALVRPLRSLRTGDLQIIAEVVDMFGWSVQSHDDYDGYPFMLIESPADSNGQMPSFMVSGEVDQLELAVIHEDECKTIGHFGDVYSLVADLASHLLGTIPLRI